MADNASKEDQGELPSDIHKLYLSPNLNEYLRSPTCSDRSHVDSPYSDVNFIFVPSHVPYPDNPPGVVNLECACAYPMRYLLIHEGSGHFAIVHNDKQAYPGLELAEPSEQSKSVANWLRDNFRGFKAAQEVARRRGESTSADLVSSMLKELSGPIDHGAALEAPATGQLSSVRRTDRPSKGKQPAKGASKVERSFEDVSLNDSSKLWRDEDGEEWVVIEHDDIDDGYEWEWVDGPGKCLT